MLRLVKFENIVLWKKCGVIAQNPTEVSKSGLSKMYSLA